MLTERSRWSRGLIAVRSWLLVVAAMVLLMAVHPGPVVAQAAKPSAAPAPVQQPAHAQNPVAAPDPAAAPATTSPPAEPPAPPLAVVPPEIIEAIRKVTAARGDTERGIEQVKDRDDELFRQRGHVEEAQTEAQRLADTLGPRRQAVKDQIDKLGPVPGKDHPAEAAAVAQDRARLLGQLGEIDAQIKKTELIQLRGRQLIGRVQDLRHTIFTRDLLRRTRSPLHPATWSDVAHEWPAAQQELMTIAQSWWGRLVANWQLAAGVLLLGVAVNLALRRLFRRIVMRWQRMNFGAEPTFFQRASVSAVLTLARTIPGIAAAGVLYAGGVAFDLFGGLTAQIAEGVLGAFIAFAVVSALASAVLEPRLARWRLFDLDDESARRLASLVKATAAVYAIDIVVHDMIRLFHLSLPVSIVATFIASSAFAALLIGIVRTPIRPVTAVAVAPSRWGPHWLKLPLLVLALVVIGASVFGYVALGRFIAGHVLLTGSGLTLMALLHLAIRALAEQAHHPETRIGRALTDRLGFDAARSKQAGTGLAVCLNAVLIAIGLPLMLMAWGFSPADITRTAKAAVFGFEIGQFRISLARLLIAVGLFLGVIFVTRLLQRWMQTKIFPTAKFDAGVSNSIETGVGYAGFAIAAMAGISYAGFDVSNLAIVAGALSVGIGFGLQSIVNNFVSGLILLVERPIKVGDWIVVKDREGMVRSISVRSTEIETFDRSSLIVPNSELITGMVVNWTHRNSVGRVKIKVGVSYDADPERVQQVLLQIAERNTHVLSHPKPQVVFEEFGASSMDFSLRVYLADIYDRYEVQTELRTAIVQTFRAEGIAIPYPQYEVSLRNLSGLSPAIANVHAAALDAGGKAMANEREAAGVETGSQPVPVSIKLAR